MQCTFRMERRGMREGQTWARGQCVHFCFCLLPLIVFLKSEPNPPPPSSHVEFLGTLLASEVACIPTNNSGYELYCGASYDDCVHLYIMERFHVWRLFLLISTQCLSPYRNCMNKNKSVVTIFSFSFVCYTASLNTRQFQVNSWITVDGQRIRDNQMEAQ